MWALRVQYIFEAKCTAFPTAVILPPVDALDSAPESHPSVDFLLLSIVFSSLILNLVSSFFISAWFLHFRRYSFHPCRTSFISPLFLFLCLFLYPRVFLFPSITCFLFCFFLLKSDFAGGPEAPQETCCVMTSSSTHVHFLAFTCFVSRCHYLGANSVITALKWRSNNVVLLSNESEFQFLVNSVKKNNCNWRIIIKWYMRIRLTLRNFHSMKKINIQVPQSNWS